MEQLINNFGINGYLLAAQIVNFLIILYLLKRFAYKPILELLEKRKKTIEEGQKNAERAEKALQEATEKEKQILRNAQNESKKLLNDVSKQAETVIDEAHEKARKQVEKMLSDAKEQIEKQRKTTERDLALHVTQLAVDIVKKTMSDFVDEKLESQIVEKIAKKLKK